MRKLLTVLLSLLMIITLVGCNSKQEETVNQEEIKEEPSNQEEEIVGGWIDAEDPTITDELKEIFETALNGLLGAKYEPVKLLATQVVNGINYKFLANGTKTTNPITKGTYNITINKSTDGTISLIDIETIEETQEEVKKTVSNLDVTNMLFWVVTFDQYGNEVDRYTAKYGSTVYDPNTGKAVTVKGNTRFYVTKDYSTDSSKEPSPAFTPIEDNTLHKGDIIKIMSESSGHDLYLVLKISGNEATLVCINYQEESNFSTDNGEYENSALDVACNTTFYGNLSSTLQDAIVEKTIELNQYTLNTAYYDEDSHPMKTDISTKVTLGTINRKVYALDLEDIEEYLGSTYSIDNVNTITNGDCWFRSITDSGSWFAEIGDAQIMAAVRSVEQIIRPSFVIDLTKNIEYKKMIKVSLLQFSGDVFGTTYANKGDRVIDLDILGSGSQTFVEKTYGLNNMYLINLEEAYMAAFTISYDQLISVFNHNDLISIEKLFTDDIREDICELEANEYDTSANEWSQVQWDSVTSDYDENMFFDMMYSFFVIDYYYETNSAAYDAIINKLKPYIVSSNLTVTNDTITLYTTTG